jgi:protein-arginine kinase activator protein McsA
MRINYYDVFRLIDEMFGQLDFNPMGGEWKSQTKTSADGTTKVTTHYWSNDNSNSKTETVERLKIQLENAIEHENFELAVALRDKIKSLETNKELIEKLELELKQSIQEQNFEKSIEIRDQLKKLKS